MRQVLVTGASGFVGTALTAQLARRGLTVRGAVRGLVPGIQPAELAPVGDVGPDTDWRSALAGVDTVMHLAARVHVMNEHAEDPLRAFRRVNVEGTRRLAEQAAAGNVRRLVFVSSVKVHGERSLPGRPLTIFDPPVPEDAYGQSKLEAEQVLRDVALETGLEVVIVRPPLVYGRGVKGNFGRLVQLIRLGMPLPLSAIENRRSLIGLDNLVDFLVCCGRQEEAAGSTFMVSDDEVLSTPDLMRRLARAMDRRVQLFPVPVSTLRTIGRLLGRNADVERLVGSLEVDISHTREKLGWKPPVSVDEGLRNVMTDHHGSEDG